MPEMRGCDLVVEYLIREKVPYLFGYAGHGAVGLLDGVYDRQDEIKIVFPRIESGAGYMADAYFRASGKVIPVYTSTGPGADAAHGRDGERVLRLLGVHRDHGPGGDEPVRLRGAPGGVPPLPGRLPGIAKVITKRSFQAHSVEDLGEVPAEGVQAGPHRPARGPVHIDVPYDLWIRRRPTSRCRSPRSAPRCSTGARRARPRRSSAALDLLLTARRPLILAGGGVICSDASAELAAFAEHVNVPVYTTFMGKGALSAAPPAPPRASPAAGASTRPPKRPGTPT